MGNIKVGNIESPVSLYILHDIIYSAFSVSALLNATASMKANTVAMDSVFRQQYDNTSIPIAIPVTDQEQQKQSSTRKKTAYQFSFRKLLGNGVIRLSDFIDKVHYTAHALTDSLIFVFEVILIVNVASHCNATTKEYIYLNRLAENYPALVIIGCPCNQFGHQENLIGEEILTSLKHIRPGNNFSPKFELTEKIEVNGANAHPLYNHLRLSLPFPSDRTLIYDMTVPGGFYTHPMRIVWMPVSRTDISWNFEKVCVSR